MTMDVTSRGDLKINPEEQMANAKTVKRSFDVAFLMLPDEKLKHKQARSESLETSPDLQKLRTHKVPKPNGLVFPKKNVSPTFPVKIGSQTEQKSAFTKVNLLSKESPSSPSLSASPDLNYQNSLSPSPPILNRTYQTIHPNILSPNQIFKSQNLPPAYQNTFLQENLSFAAPSPMGLDHPFLAAKSDLLQPTSFAAKMRPMLGQYRHELTYSYPQFQPPPEMLKIGPAEMRNPAAAILSTLLPPSLAALSLPAQNICAKCNVSFRMTSDLVYHMRSHHKNDAVDATKKRREEKLKCSVCAESFRERHHLTRHMTAHQDKDEEEDEPVAKKKDFSSVAK